MTVENKSVQDVPKMSVSVSLVMTMSILTVFLTVTHPRDARHAIRKH